MNSDKESADILARDSEANSIPDQPIRTKLVNTASEFLASPSVQNSSMEMKIAFLKKKGLSDAEIDLAVKQSDARLMAIRDNAISGSFPPSQMQLAPMYYTPNTRWTTFRDIANAAVIVGGLFYGAYWTYKNYIVPYFFGKKDKKSIDAKLSEIERTISTCLVEINSNLGKLKEELEKNGERRVDNVHKEINDLKSEVSSLKKLLLNRKQFPTVSGLAPLSIPSWQISENDEKHQQIPEEEGNGSNGSESSLEMIKE